MVKLRYASLSRGMETPTGTAYPKSLPCTDAPNISTALQILTISLCLLGPSRFREQDRPRSDQTDPSQTMLPRMMLVVRGRASSFPSPPTLQNKDVRSVRLLIPRSTNPISPPLVRLFMRAQPEYPFVGEADAPPRTKPQVYCRNAIRMIKSNAPRTH
nr:hypothetical protein CFP56_57950 [Quercus suber]